MAWVRWLLVLGLLAAFVRLLHAWLQWRVIRRMPHPHSSDWTIAGSMSLIRDVDHVAETLTKEADRLGTGIFSMRVFGYSVVVVTDPVIMHQALSLPKFPHIYRAFNALTSPDGRAPNLIGHYSNDGYWRLVRKGVAPAFAPAHIRAEFPHLLSVVDRMSAVIAAAGPDRFIDVDNLLQRESMEVIGRVGFGYDFGAIEQFGKGPAGAGGGGAAGGGEAARHDAAMAALVRDEVFVSLKSAAVEISKRWTVAFRQHLRHVLPAARRGSAHMMTVQAHMRGLLAALRARGPPAPDNHSIIAHLMRLRDPKTGLPALTDEQLAGEIGLFLFAGFESTAHGMAWALYLLARHPEARAKVEAELDSLGLLVTPQRPRPRVMEYGDMAWLRYLGFVMKEAQRLVPVVGNGTVRYSPRPIRLGGYDVPANVQLVLLIKGLHTSARNWERPQEFDPERWRQPGAEYWQGSVQGEAPQGGGGAKAADGADALFVPPDEEENQNRPRRYLPFSGGVRGCLGANLAKMNYTSTMAVLLSRFTFQLPDDLMATDPKQALWELHRNIITAQPQWKGKGLPMRVIPRPTA